MKVETKGKKPFRPTLYGDKAEIDFVVGLDGVEIDQVACGFNHTVALSKQGEVYTWGQGKQGALGHGDFEQQNVPKKVESLSGIV